MNIAFLDTSTIILDDDMDLSSLEDAGQLTCFAQTAPEEIVGRLADTDAAVVNKVPMTRGVIEALSSLKHIAVIATGYNNVDLDAAREAGVLVTNVSGYARYTVPQHTFALILNLASRVHQYDRDVRDGAWERSSTFTLLTYPTFELSGKVIGIVGFGAIGRAIAQIAEGFGMKVMANDYADISTTGYRNCTLDEIYAEADVVTLHCPLTDDNRYMVGAEALERMKPSALLINTARGPLVDQAALADALANGTIAGAGIDVLDEEPPKRNPLLEYRGGNLLVTPHAAWSAREARQRLIDEVAANIKAAAQGQPRNVVVAPA